MSTNSTSTDLPPLSSFSEPVLTFQAKHPGYPSDLAVGAVIIRPSTKLTDNQPAALILQRAPSDSYGLKWDIPGGGVDVVPDPRNGPDAKADSDIVSACKREVVEETGLHPLRVVDIVFYHEWEEHRWWRWIKAKTREFWRRSTTVVAAAAGSISEIVLVPGTRPSGGTTAHRFAENREAWTGKFTFLVEVDEIHGDDGKRLLNNREITSTTPPTTSPGSDSTTAKGTTEIADETESEIDIKITLSPNEHQTYRWITESEIDDLLRPENRDRLLEQFIDEEELSSVQAAFRKWRMDVART